MDWSNAGGWGSGGWSIPAAGGGGGANSAAYTNFIARTSGLNTAHLNAYATLLNGLTTDGFFDGSGNSTLLDGLWVFATQDQTTANLNLVKGGASYGPGTVTGTPTWTADAGYTNGSGTSYLDTNLNLSTLGGNAVQNGWHLSSWNNATITTNGVIVSTGGANGHIYPKFSDGKAYFRIGDGAAAGVANSSPQGFYLGNRSGAAAWQGYINSSQVTSGTDASSALDNATIGYPNHSGSGNSADIDAVVMAGSTGATLNATQVSNLYSRLHVYLQTIAGVP